METFQYNEYIIDIKKVNEKPYSLLRVTDTNNEVYVGRSFKDGKASRFYYYEDIVNEFAKEDLNIKIEITNSFISKLLKLTINEILVVLQPYETNLLDTFTFNMEDNIRLQNKINKLENKIEELEKLIKT